MNHNKPPDDDHGLALLKQDIPPPRRSDDAFARSVADGVKRARSPRVLFLPALAAGAAALAFVVTRPAAPVQVARVLPPAHVVDAGGAVPLVHTEQDSPGEPPVDLEEADPGPFTLPSLDGSSDRELLAFEQRLDERIDAQITQARTRQKL